MRDGLMEPRRNPCQPHKDNAARVSLQTLIVSHITNFSQQPRNEFQDRLEAACSPPCPSHIVT